MSAVDVLAVMDSAEVRCGPTLAAAMVEARAAVAELIEADKRYDNAQFALARARYNSEPLAPHIAESAEADIRRAAALFNVQGESA